MPSDTNPSGKRVLTDALASPAVGDASSILTKSGDAAQAVSDATPSQKFNQALVQMLQNYQLGTAKFQGASLQAQQNQAQAIMAPAQQGFSPSNQESMRQGQAGVFGQQAKEAQGLGQTFGEQIQGFKDTVSQARNLMKTYEDIQNKQRDDARNVIKDALTLEGGNAFQGADLQEIARLEKLAGYPKGFLENAKQTLKERDLQQKSQFEAQTNIIKEQSNYYKALASGYNVPAPSGVTPVAPLTTTGGNIKGFNTTDASLPDISVSNTPIPELDGRTPNAIVQNAIAYALQGGNLQQFVGGLSSKDPRTQAIKNAIDNKASAFAAMAGTTLPELRMAYKNATSAQRGQVDFANQVSRALKGAEQGATLTQKLFAQKGINPNSSTFVNTTLNDLTKLFGDSGDIRAYQSAMVEIGNEYAQVFARGGQRSVEGNKIAQDVINGNIRLADMQKVLATLQSIGQTVIGTAVDQMNNLAVPQELTRFMQVVNGTPAKAFGSSSNPTKTKSGKPFDYQSAKSAGYSDSEIQDYINSH